MLPFDCRSQAFGPRPGASKGFAETREAGSVGLMASPKFPLSGFADEVDDDLRIQAKTFAELGIGAADMRSAFGKNVMQLTDEELRETKRIFGDHGVGIQAVGTAINKVPANPENRVAELEKTKRAVEVAHVLGVERIRLFSPEVGADEHDSRAQEVLDWMADQIGVATQGAVILLHENDAKYWGAYPANAQRMFEALPSPHFKAAFDFANTVILGFRPMNDWFPWILPHLDTLHIKDAVQNDHKVVPAGEGEGQLSMTIAWLIAQGWMGPLTMEPHLQAAGPLGGFSGPELFRVATEALRKVLAEVGAEA